ncbi:MAG: Na/Pi cotransporter family protein [Phycisphaerales bacterium]
MDDQALDFTAMTVTLLGGLAIFLYGMGTMTDALKAVAGAGMKDLLGRLTRNRFSGAISGALVTAVIQSSSVTTVLVVGFVSAGLMNLTQAVGVIMGANIGTTITAQIIAFKVTDYALAMVALGFTGFALSRRPTVRQIGAMLLGLGFIFLGMGMMSEATNPLRTYEPFVQFMAGAERPLLAMLAAAVFTALVQSSSATTGVVIVLASQGFITLETGIALALGANIGTCVTAMLAAIGKPRAALQTATVHLLFNTLGAMLWVFLIPVLASVVREISPASPNLEGAERLAAETPRQIANAHTLFNVANTVIFIGFTGSLARLVQRIVPDRPEPARANATPAYLDDVYLATTPMALGQVRLEVARLGDQVCAMVRDTAPMPGGQRADLAGRLAVAARDVRELRAAIVRYARRMLTGTTAPAEVDTLEDLLMAASHLHSIADTIALNLAAVATEWRSRGLQASDETRRQAIDLHGAIVEALEDTVRAIRDADLDAAARAIGAKQRIDNLADRLARHVTMRLTSDTPEREATYRLELAWIELAKRLYYFAKRAAKTIDATNPGPDNPQPGATAASITETPHSEAPHA